MSDRALETPWCLQGSVAYARHWPPALRISAAPAMHRRLLARCQPLNGAQGVPAVPAQRKARREYENRVSTLTPPGP
ncbi:hypothetical protein ACH4S9_46090 [Streptomyces sp. NPDC021225]|uniref:hypothetical protein n=1 Tax=Streptomyces sp. NPDC021225 TaxID=3365121 RepID=UPI0037BAD4F4